MKYEQMWYELKSVVGYTDGIRHLLLNMEAIEKKHLGLQSPRRGRLKFYMYGDEGRSISCVFIDGKGRSASTWFSAPPESIDHVGPEYLRGRFNNVANERHMEFIKRRYKEEYQRLRGGEA